MQERKGVATLKGNPLTLVGPEIKVGDKAPEFIVRKGLSDVKSSEYAGKIRLISVVPSLDTPVCDAQTRKFNDEASKLGDNVKILTISMDLPFAGNKFCDTAGIKNLDVLSDYKDADFGIKYGVLIKEHRLDMRAIFVVDKDDTVKYVQIVPEMTDHPDYEHAIAALKALAK